MNYKQIMCTTQGFSWTEIYFGHFVQAAPLLLGHLEFFRTFINIHFYHHKTEIAICPSQIETRGSFATITDGKCGLIDCLAFLFHEETGAC